MLFISIPSVHENAPKEAKLRLQNYKVQKFYSQNLFYTYSDIEISQRVAGFENLGQSQIWTIFRNFCEITTFTATFGLFFDF